MANNSAVKVLVKNVDKTIDEKFLANLIDEKFKLERFIDETNDKKSAELTFANEADAKKFATNNQNKQWKKYFIQIEIPNFLSQNQEQNKDTSLLSRYKPDQHNNQKNGYYNQNQTNEIMNNENKDDEKENIGIVVYPLAKQAHPDKSPKITGMLIEAILKVENKFEIEKLLASEISLKELIEVAYEKLI